MYCSENRGQKPLTRLGSMEKEALKNIVGIPHTEDYSRVMSNKKHVLDELKRNPSYQYDSSDSEKESEIASEADSLYYGTTPPREVRRGKNKFKEMRAIPKIYSNEKIKQEKRSCTPNFFQKKMREKRYFKTQMDECINTIPRASQQFVMLNSKQCLKSISQKKASYLSRASSIQSSPSVAQAAVKINYKRNRKSSKLQFYKSFFMMVKLGDRAPMQDTNHQVNEEMPDEDEWQVAYPELLWLELQAWQANRTVEDQDCISTEQRQKIDDVLDQVINYKYLPKHEDIDVASSEGNTEEKETVEELEEEFITIKITDNPDETPTLQGISQDNKESNVAKDCGGGCHVEHTLAMKDVMELLKKVENAESLYPSLRALIEEHPKYNDAKFKKNMQAMILWLNITKDLFHKIHLLADWIDVDPDDVATWDDWFRHGLGLRCLKTSQRYQDTHYLSTGDMIDSVASSTDLNFLATLGSARKAKKDRKRLSHQHRNSFIERTTTSRYRSFVEKALRDGGVYNLMKRMKELLFFTLSKAEHAFLDLSEYDQHKALVHDKKMISLLQHYKKLFPGNSLDVFEDIHEKQMLAEKLSFLKGGLWGKVCADMNLPSMLNLYVFVVVVPADIIHECIRFRLDCKPKVAPSFHSIKQLVNECKEVILGGIICKIFIFDAMVMSLNESKLSRCIAEKIKNYDKDMKSILDLYFEYLASWFDMLEKNKSITLSFKNIMEDEWSFVKEISPYVNGAEIKAGHKFCNLVCGTLKSMAECLENYSEEKLSACIDRVHCQSHAIPDVMEHKLVYKELREKTTQLLTFAKTLKKDLGVAAHYKIISSYKEIIKILDINNHVKLKFNCDTDYDIFIPSSFSKRPKKCFEVLKLHFDCDMEKVISHHIEDYILVLKHQDNRTVWKGRTCHFDNTHNFTLLLPHISPLAADLMLICDNSYHLKTQCRRIESIFDKSIDMVIDQTSSYKIISDSIMDIKKAALNLADISSQAIEHFLRCMALRAVEMDEADKNTITKVYVDGLHCCFAFSFEYLRELVRLFQGNDRAMLMPQIIQCAKLWMEFVVTKTDKGRGSKPRWATQGLEFLLLAIDPSLGNYLTNAEFRELQTKMQDCLSHIIGNVQPKKKKDRKTLNEKRSSSPFTMHRSRSVPLRKSETVTADRQDKTKTFSLPVNYTPNEDSNMLSVPEMNHSISGESDMSSGDISLLSEDILEEEYDSCELPLTRIKKAVQEIDERRTAKLQHMRVIGSVTDKKANIVSELVTLRKVNFKWQLGNKIGEGQFGQVYSSVNLDTGELMAVKRIHFNPNDYGTIQDIADEITNIQGLQHDSLVRYYGVELHRDEMLIFMEYCADGTIAEIAKLDLPESMIRVYTYQITKAINFLHQNGVIHRDIKGANIFVSSSGLIKIGDFGSAVKLRDALATTHGEMFTLRGTAAFMAPEVITLDKGHGYGRAADIWSLGCVVVEMTTGKQPWVDLDNIYAIMFKVGDGQHPPIPDRLSEEGQDFLQHCFVHDQQNRWTAHMLEDHAFVKCC